jgi:Alr-MurF fusion protein
MITYTLENISAVTGGRIVGNPALRVGPLLIDSRVASVPADTLFFALPGQRHDGHRYLAELYDRGVRAFVVSALSDEARNLESAGFVVVSDTLAALQALAAYHRQRMVCPVIAITGSNGKTIVKEWLNHCLSDLFVITRSPKSYNSQVGVPLSLWLMDELTRLGIFEAGISRRGEMEKLHRMIRPDMGLITNTGEAHQENFSSMEEKVREKIRLFGGCRQLVYCSDHELIDTCIRGEEALAGTEKFTWSMHGKGQVAVSEVSRQEGHTRFRAMFGSQVLDLTIPFSDPASLENALHCLTMLLLLDTPEDIIRSGLATLPPVAMRLEQKSAINGCTLINDSYNSDVNSLSIALDLLVRQVQHPKTTLILSDILQSGQSETLLYSHVAALLKAKGITRLIGIGPALSTAATLFTLPAVFYRDTEAFLAAFDEGKFVNEAILLKGSRQFAFERIAALLEQKKHTTRIEVNLSALVHNLNFFRSLLKPGTRTMVMVKALSYGSGRHEIAGILQYQRVDYLGVAFADEGVSLRQAGITLPIMVMNPEPESFDMLIQHRLEPEIYSYRILDLFYRAVIRNQEVDYPVHLKTDTGMHRLGFTESEIPRLCHELARLRNLRVRSVFSHLAGSDEAVFDDFTTEQVAVFTRVSERIITALGYPVIRHILNSSGIERFPDAQFDMVRLGIGLYGVSSVDSTRLRNVSTLKSTVLQVKPVYPGDTVGYSRKGKVVRPSAIAIIPVGYADGLNRRLSNGVGHFLVNGTRVPVIGNICMDMTMLDITGVEVAEGDEVVLFGPDLPVSLLSEALETIPYEILTGISERVKRVYLHE